ncbi:hypothetical protein PMAYCL1PPCAC_26494, partial [Pristionchus mayeri]
MKRAAMSNPNVKITMGFHGEVITIEDDEPATEQPVVKNVKMEVQSAPDLGVTEPAREQPVVKNTSKAEVQTPSDVTVVVPASSDQPVEKSVRRGLEEEVAELKQQLQKKEDMFQRACRYARETELRAERAENLLDSKQGILENSKYTEELKMRISCITSQLEMERRKAEEDRERDRRRIEELLLNPNPIWRVTCLNNQLEMERRQANADREKDNRRIEELARLLAKHEGDSGPDEMQQLHQSPQVQLHEQSQLQQQQPPESPSEVQQLQYSPQMRQVLPPEDEKVQ